MYLECLAVYSLLSILAYIYIVKYRLHKYTMFNRDAADMRADCDLRSDVDFGRGNRAVTYIWLW